MNQIKYHLILLRRIRQIPALYLQIIRINEGLTQLTFLLQLKKWIQPAFLFVLLMAKHEQSITLKKVFT